MVNKTEAKQTKCTLNGKITRKIEPEIRKKNRHKNKKSDKVFER